MTTKKSTKKYLIIDAASEDEYDGPNEIFPELYGDVDRYDCVAVESLARELAQNVDQHLIVIEAIEVQVGNAADVLGDL
jgi:hypothetical protein